MSSAAAEAFIDRLESDEDFAKELEAKNDHPDAVLEKAHAAGFDATPEEIRAAFLDRYGAELTPEQMEQIAAGTDPVVIAGTVVGVAVWVGAASAAALA